MRLGLSIASVCRTLPTPDEPASGVFIMRRLIAQAQKSNTRILQPIPYFPIVRPIPAWAGSSHHDVSDLNVYHAPMFYVPKFLKRLDGFWYYRSIREQLTALKETGELDVIDAHFAYPDGAGCARVARELDIPVVVTIRGVEEDYMRSPSIAPKIKETLLRADASICVSYSLRELAIATGADERKVHVVHNAVNRRLFAPGDKAEARLALGIDVSQPLIVSVGNLLSVKRHDVLISAFARLSNKCARLAIIGGPMHEPDYPQELSDLCVELGVANRVQFVGRVDEDEVAKWLQAADVFALASRREGCCNAILEALATGVPVIATPVGDNAWFIKDGENGYLVPVGDSQGMGLAIDRALTRPDWDAGRLSGDLQVGDWDAVARQTLGILQDCVDRRRNPN